MIVRGLGWLKESFSSKDKPFSLAKASRVTPPVSVDKSRFVLDSLDQGPTSSCVVHAGDYLIHKNQVEQYFTNNRRMPVGPQVPRHSARRAQYYWTREETGDQKKDEGTYNRSYFDVLRNVGFASEDVCPWDTFPPEKGGLINVAPGYRVILAAVDQRCVHETFKLFAASGREWFHTFHTEVKKAIAAEGLQFGIPVDDLFVSGVGESGKLWEYNPERNVGGHSMFADSYDEDGVMGPQSWGGGRSHRFKIGWQTFLQYADDCWSLTFTPSFYGDAV